MPVLRPEPPGREPGGHAPPDLDEEEDPLLPGAAHAQGEPSPLRRPRLVALLAASAAATACGARWALQREVQDGRQAVRRAKDADVFALSRKKAGCRNWKHIQLGDIRFVHSADACSQVCRMTRDCVGFGFAEDACEDTANGPNKPGGCMMWKQPCEEADNHCWNDYVLVSGDSGSHCEVPEMPGLEPGGRSCPEADEVSCLNGNRSYAQFDEAWTGCSVLSECAVIVKASDGRYYLRREADPEIAAGESVTYSCRTVVSDNNGAESEIAAAESGPPTTTMVGETTVTHTLGKHIQVTEDLATFQLGRLDYEKLLDNPDLYEATLEEIKKSIAEEYGVSPDAVEIELSGGG